MKNSTNRSNPEPIDPVNLRIIILTVGTAIILSLIYLLEPGPTKMSAQRRYDVVFELTSPNPDVDWAAIKGLFAAEYSDGSTKANVTEENIAFSDNFYDTAGADLGKYGYELRFRSVVDPSGRPMRSRLDLIQVTRDEEDKNSLSLTVTNLALEDEDGSAPPEDGQVISDAITRTSRNELEARLQEISVAELALLNPVLKVDQKRRRLKFSEEGKEILSVALDESSAARGEKKVSDARIIIQPNNRLLEEAPEDVFNAHLDYARSVIGKISERFSNLRLTRERLTEKFLRQLREQG